MSAPMFSKRHYEAIAELFAEAYYRTASKFAAGALTDEQQHARRDALNETVVLFGALFAADNSKFKWPLFNGRITVLTGGKKHQ